MSRRKSRIVSVIFTMALCLLSACGAALVQGRYQQRRQFEFLGALCGELERSGAADRQSVMELVKRKDELSSSGQKDYLEKFGYVSSDFSQGMETVSVAAGIGFLAGAGLLLAICWYEKRRMGDELRALTERLERVNRGEGGPFLETSESEFAKLGDEICKTVTALIQTRELALKAKQRYADHLSNIAHQLKTPITAMSLSLQMMQGEGISQSRHVSRIKNLLGRLTRLEEALLLLARIDADGLSLKRREVDLFTLLTLSADNLQELLEAREICVDIPETAELKVSVDLDWTMEAVMNLMKNCMEHSPAGGTVHCCCQENPLYVQIKIWDEGEGFDEEELGHLFERFYRGKHAAEGSIGIGLAIAREIIQRQNGMLEAYNLPQGGACFEIRLYCH